MANRNWVKVILLGTIWGGSFYFVEVLLLYFDPQFLVFLRLSSAAASLYLVCRWLKVALPRSFSDWLVIVVMGLFANAIPFTLISYGQTTITGGLSSILNSSTAFFAIVLGAIFIAQERLTWNRLLGVCIGIVGVAMTINIRALLSLDPENLGQYFVLIAAFSYGISSVWAKQFLGHINPVALATGMTMASSVTMLIIMLLTAQPLILIPATEMLQIGLAGGLVFNTLFLGVICTGMAYILFFDLIKTAGASNTALCTLIVAPVAISLDSLLLQQYPLIEQLVGMLVIIFGLILLDGRVLGLLHQYLRLRKGF